MDVVSVTVVVLLVVLDVLTSVGEVITATIITGAMCSKENSILLYQW